MSVNRFFRRFWTSGMAYEPVSCYRAARYKGSLTPYHHGSIRSELVGPGQKECIP